MEQAGRDVVACLNEAMGRQGLDMQVSALVGSCSTSCIFEVMLENSLVPP